MSLKEDYNLPDGLITLGTMKPIALITALFYTGIIGVIYCAFQIGRYISISLAIKKTTIVDYGFTEEITNNVALGFIAGVFSFIVLFVIWKVTCELLLLIFNALRFYVRDSKQ